MRLEYDREARAIYVHVADGEQARTIEILPEKIYADVDAENRPLGIEFLGFDTFNQYVHDHRGLHIPERIEGPQSLLPVTA